MLAILLFLCFFSIYLVLRKFEILGWRGSLLLAATFFGVLLTAWTELLSLLRSLEFWPLVAAWSLAFLLLSSPLAFSSRKRFDFHPNLPGSHFERALVVCVFLIVLVVAVIAWVAPPNTWDSMTYHMSRVMHWIQNKSVAYYPTHISRQLHHSPWSEYAILHLQILSGGDRFANFVQWFSMLGSIVGASLLAKELGAALRGQIFAAVICATIPMGILQGSSTQTDYVVSFWLVCLVYFVLLLKKQANMLYALGAGAALGLGILTKATAFIFATPFFVWLGLAFLKPRQISKLRLVAIALGIAFFVNLGYFARNYDLYGNPFGPAQGEENIVYSNEIFSFPAITSNLIRNIGLHLATPGNGVNSFLDRGIAFMHRIIGISANNPLTTWIGVEFHIPNFSFHEDGTGNLLHLILILATVLIFLFQRSKGWDTAAYLMSLLAAMLLFCGYLKWQPWHSRLHLPLFVLSAPFAGYVLSRMRVVKIVNLSMTLLVAGSLPWVFLNASRPILGVNNIFTMTRGEQYFINDPDLADPYNQAAQYLVDRNCSEVGLVMGVDDWEYPLWVLLGEKTGSEIRLEHTQVMNISQRKNAENLLDSTSMCAVVSINTQPLRLLTVGEIVYSQTFSSDPVTIYTPVLNP